MPAVLELAHGFRVQVGGCRVATFRGPAAAGVAVGAPAVPRHGVARALR
jgi:hypothetical protein